MYKSTLIFLLIFFSIDAYPQNQLSLSEAITKGLANNYQMQISKIDKTIAANNNTWGTAGVLPTVTAGIRQNNTFDNTESRTVENERNDTKMNAITPYLNANWTIFNGFSGKIVKATLTQTERLSEQQLRIQIENTIQSVTEAYYAALLQQEQQRVLKEVMELSRDRYNYILLKKDFGNAVTYDVLQAKNAYLSDSSKYIQQQLNVTNAMLNLKLLMAEPSNSEYMLTDSFRVVDEFYDLDNLKQQMLSSNNYLQLQQLSLKLSELDVESAKSSLYPTLLLNAGADQSNSRLQVDNNPATDSYSWGLYGNLTLSYNLFSGGNRQRKIQNAAYNRQIAELELSEFKHELDNQLTNVFLMFKLRRELYDVAVESEKAVRLNMQISTDKYKAGTINSFNYRDVQLLYLNTATNKLQAMYNLISAHISLLKITGKLVQEKL